MTTERLPPITYVEIGNKVPKTEGAKLCMTLPKGQGNRMNATVVNSRNSR